MQEVVHLDALCYTNYDQSATDDTRKKSVKITKYTMKCTMQYVSYELCIMVVHTMDAYG